MTKSIGRLVSILHRQSQVYMNEALKEYSISSAEYFFLLALYAQPGRTQDELSCYLRIDKAATARAIKSLEEKEYVYRDKDENDKRCNLVYVTEKALRYEEEIKAKVRHWSELLTEGLEEETNIFLYDTLEAMIQKIDANVIKKTKEK